LFHIITVVFDRPPPPFIKQNHLLVLIDTDITTEQTTVLQ